MAYRAAAERKYGDTLQFQVQRPRRTVNRRPMPSSRPGRPLTACMSSPQTGSRRRALARRCARWT